MPHELPLAADWLVAPTGQYLHNKARKSTGSVWRTRLGCLAVQWAKWVAVNKPTKSGRVVAEDTLTVLVYAPEELAEELRQHECSQAESEGAWCAYGR